MDVAIGRAVLTSLGEQLGSAPPPSRLSEPRARRSSRKDQLKPFLFFFFKLFFHSGELAGASQERDYPGRIPLEPLMAMESPLKSGNS